MADLFNIPSDAALDSSVASLFGTSAGPVQRPLITRQSDESEQPTPNPKGAQKKGKTSDKKSEKTKKRKLNDTKENTPKEGADEETEKKASAKKQKTDSDEEDDGSLEERWVEKQSSKNLTIKSKSNKTEKTEDDDSDSEVEQDTKKSEIPQQEIDKADATIFVGNIPISVIKSKKVKSQFMGIWEAIGAVRSVRFRSVAFSKILPRKIAFLQQNLHTGRDSANAYVVFEKAEDARKAVKLNATVFEDHHLRVDSVSHPAEQKTKQCVFVGNLDFDVNDELIWKHFGSCGEIEYVRVVRDEKTNVGKGFCYVQFADPVAVTKALMLNGKKMVEEKGRELRVTRCKNMRESNRQRSSVTPKRNTNPRRLNLSADEKTKVGRAKAAVGKSARKEIDSAVEGTRAKKGDYIPGLNAGGKKKKRITKRSTNYKTLGKTAKTAQKQ